MPFDPLANSDVCSLTLLLGVLGLVGHYVVGSNVRLRSLGWQLGFGVAVVAVVGAFWARIPKGAEEWLGVVIRALLLGAFAVTIAWITAPPVFLVYGQGVERPLHWLQQLIGDRKRRRNARKGAQEEAERRRRAAEEWDRQAPQREAARREHEAAEAARQLEREEQARKEAECQRRRDESRARCEIVFALVGPDVSDRFTKAEFQLFMQRYLGDDRSPEYVEERGQQLMELIYKHLELVDPRRRFASLAELTNWYQRQKEQLELVSDERLKRTLIARLNGHYAELSTQLLEEMHS